MRVAGLRNMVKSVTAILAVAACISAAHAGVKNVAVVETEVDEESGASELISAAEVRLVTAELRREAVKNLSQRKYNIMTTETVMAQGSAVLLECADENCVISLGSKIGADFIVRGHISRIDAKLSLFVDVYETDDGNLVASSEAVRAEKVADLLEAVSAACGEMYKAFVTAQNPETVATAKSGKMSIGGGALFASDFGGGITWENDGQIKTPFYGYGAYISLDLPYTLISIGFLTGGGRSQSPNNINQDELPTIQRASINFGVSAKYPNFTINNMKLCPIVGIEYDLPVSAKIDKPEYNFDGNDDRYGADALSALWVKIGAGVDIYLNQNTYIRSELLYGARTSNKFESESADKTTQAGKPRLGHGLTFKAGAGIKI